MGNKPSSHHEANNDGATALQKSYMAQLNRALKRIEGKNPIEFQKGEDPFDCFMNWLEVCLVEKQNALMSLNQYNERVRSDGIKIHNLEKELEDHQIRQRGFEREKKTLERQHQDNMRQLEIQYNQRLDEVTQDHQRNIFQVDQEKKKLLGQLLVNQDDNSRWPDDKLKFKYRELQRQIDNITSPQNAHLQISEKQQWRHQLDPTNFLSRIPNGRSHILLKSMIWQILTEQFFSAPFGFGAFGPGDARNELIKFCSSWRMLTGKSGGSAMSYDELIRTFNHDQLSNNWRSATFQSINAALTPTDVTHSNSSNYFAKMDTTNVNSAFRRITEVLSEVAKLNDSHIGSEIQPNIRIAVDLAREIGIQIGIHTARIRLIVPPRGEKVRIGDDFHDCEDGDMDKGNVVAVDIVVVPGLQKIGDGRSDMTTARPIVPCEFYPIQNLFD